MGPKPKKFKRVEIVYPPVPTRKWRPPDRPHVANPFKRKPIKRLPIYPEMHDVPKSTLEKIWHQYKIFAKNSCILPGQYSQNNVRFALSVRGKQGPATCLVAIGFTKVKDVAKWNKNSISSILDIGTKLYHQSLSINRSVCDCTSPREVHNTYFIDDYYFVMVVDDDVEFKGTVFKEPEHPYFKDELKKVFPLTDYCMLEIDGKFMAIWKFHGSYYVFDPNDRDISGNRVHEGTGVAAVFKFVQFSKMVLHIQSTLATPGQRTAFTIFLIHIKKFYKSNLAPPKSLTDIALPPILTSVKQPPKSCLASRVPTKIEIIDKVGPIPGPPGSKPDKKIIKKEPETEVAVENLSDSNTPSFSDLLDAAKLEEHPNLFPIEKPTAPPVTYYQWIIPHRMAILIGGCHQQSGKCTLFEGKQSLGNAIAAIGMLRQYRSKYWYPKIIDEILLTGETIYIESRQIFIGDHELTLQNIVETFKINKTEYKHYIDEITIVGQLNSDKPNVLDLKPALQEFFTVHDAGIIRGPLLLAVWSEEGKYYMFDPNERDKKGRLFEKQYSVEWPDQLISSPGFACVTWYASISDLVSVYMLNVRRELRREIFYISNIEVKDYIAIPEMWNNFTALKPGKWILRGTFSQNNTHFPPVSRNTGSTAIATMSIVIANTIKCSEWDRSTIDEILIEGDKLHTLSVDTLKAKNIFVSKQLSLNEMYHKVSYEDKQLNISVEECLVNGTLIPRAEKVEGLFDLQAGCEFFFRDNDSGVLTSKGMSFAIWKFEDSYFYFDSHARDDRGYANYGGVACVIRFDSLTEMVRVILANINPQGFDLYNIGRVEITVWEKTSEGTVKPNFYDYTELSFKKGIIRSSVHQGDCERFDLRAGFQTIPNLLAALAMTSIIPCNRWTTTIMDQILTIGDKLYEDSRWQVISKDLENSGSWESQEKPVDMDLINTENVIKKIRIGVNKIFIDVQTAKEGIFEPDKVTRDKTGNVIYQDTELQNLLWNALENKDVLKDSRHEIILDSEHITIAIWKDHDDLYYVFDPKGKDCEGNFFGRDLWSAKIVILDEEYDMRVMYGHDHGDGLNTNEHLRKSDNADIMKLDYSPDDEDEEEEEEEDLIPIKIDIADAKACTIMFATFDDLYKHIMENVRPNKRTDHFKIYPILIASMPEMHELTNPQDKAAGNWYNFEEVEKGTWILRGTMDLSNSTFPEVNRGRQCGSMCVSACVYSRIYALPKYKPTTVDYILKYGDKLHTAVRRSKEIDLKRLQNEMGLSDDEIFAILRDTEIPASQVLKQFLIGDYHVLLTIQESAIVGDITAVEKEPPPPPPSAEPAKSTTAAAAGDAPVPLKKKRSRMLAGSIKSKYSTATEIFAEPSAAVVIEQEEVVKQLKEPVVISLRKGIKNFFKEHMYGIFNSKGNSVAFWKVHDFYYLFDPDSRGPSGLKEINGFAFIMRFAHMRELVEVITKNLSKDGTNTYKIDVLSIKTKLAVRPAPSIPAVLPVNPKMTAFREISPNKHILRGSFHQDNPKFNLSPNTTGACNAIVALSMAQLHPGETWSKPIIDDIVMNAFRLYKQSVIALGNDFNEWEDVMVLESINKEFKIGVVNVNWGINLEGFQRGILNIKSPDIPNLRKCCEEFFMDFTMGVIQSSPLTVGFWLSKELIYMFDPNSRGATGLYSTGGTACLLIFNTVKDMVEHFLNNVPPRLHREEFTICPVEIMTYETKPKKVPPMKKEDILKVKDIDSLSGYVDSEKNIDIRKRKKPESRPYPEFYCDKPRKPHKVNHSRKKSKSTKDPCCCPDKQRIVPHKKIVVDENRFSPVDKKKWARDKSEAKKIKELQAKEHRLRAKFYTLDNGDAIVRAHYSQNAAKFSMLSRNKQAHANALVGIVMSKLHEPKTWSYKNIEIILESGDILFKDSFIKFRPNNPLLGLKNLIRTFYIFHLRISTVIYKPFVFGNCIYEDLYVALLNFFMQETAGIIVTDHESFALAVFQKAGQYYLFDPHDRDVMGEVTNYNGCACLIRFDNIENLVEKFMRNSQIDQEGEDIPRFSICAVGIESVERITK